ncbi:MAG: hypothetical protein WCA44_18050 [Acidobacteriaceae bacterium]
MKPPPMPAAVKVGPHVYRVLLVAAQMPKIDGETPNACIDLDALTVKVAARLRRSKMQELSLHEFLHAMWPKGYGFEEELVTALAPRLLQLLRDNPELVRYLTS